MSNSVRQIVLQSKHHISLYKTWLLEHPSRILYSLGLLGFYWYPLTIFMGPDGHLISVGLLLLAFIGYWGHRLWPKIRRSSLFWLSLTTTLYVLIRTLFACLEFPDISAFQMTMGLKMAHMGGLTSLLLLPWLIEDGKWLRADWILLLLVISFLGNIYLTLNWTQFSAIIFPQNQFYFRDELRVNPNTAGALAGIFLLGLVTVGLKWVREIRRFYGYILTFFAMICWIVVIWILLSIIINSESRSGWIAIGIVLILFLIGLIIYHLNKQNEKEKAEIILIFCFIIVGSLVVWKEGDRILKQFNREEKTLTHIAYGQVHHLSEQSVGIRIRLWQFGSELFRDRPIFGWGPGSVKFKLKKQGNEIIKQRGHLHSALFQLAAQFGAIGAILFICMFMLSLFVILRSSMMGFFPVEWTLFGAGGLIIYIIYSSVNSPFHHEQYRYMLIILVAIAMNCQIVFQNSTKNKI